MTNYITFLYEAETLRDHKANMDFVDEVYAKNLKYTFDMQQFVRIKKQDAEEKPTLVVMLSLNDGSKVDKKMPNKAYKGLGQLSRRSTKKLLTKVNEMPEADWETKANETDI